MKKVLLTGAKGQLGQCFLDRASNDWNVLATDYSELDISDLEAVDALISQYNPDVIINAAAYTSVDKAEQEPERAYKVNVIGPKNLALLAKKVNAKLFHVSTDYVFNGENTIPYLETDKTSPLGVYGQTKLDGEQEVLSIYRENSIIIRTAWVYSEYGNNFVKTMLRLAKERNELNVVNDQIGCPTYAGDIANCIVQLIFNNTDSGIYNYTGSDIMSWYDFTNSIIDIAYKLEKLYIITKVNSILTSQYPTLSARPKYSVLDNQKIRNQGIPSSEFKTSLETVISKL